MLIYKESLTNPTTETTSDLEQPSTSLGTFDLWSYHTSIANIQVHSRKTPIYQEVRWTLKIIIFSNYLCFICLVIWLFGKASCIHRYGTIECMGFHEDNVPKFIWYRTTKIKYYFNFGSFRTIILEDWANIVKN